MPNIPITVIVPVYKVEKYLKDCIDSIINQTFRNIEIILVDDGSPDRCGAICDEYAQKDERIVVIHKQNGGLGSARNAALDIAKGDYILFADSDDTVEPTFCESPLKKAIEHNADIVKFGFTTIGFTKDGSRYPHHDVPRIIDNKEAMRLLIYRNFWPISNMVCNKLFARKLFDKIRFPEGRVYEDHSTTYKLIHRAKRIYVLDELLYNYYKRNESITGSENIDKPKTHMDLFLAESEKHAFIKQFYPELFERQTIYLAKKIMVKYKKLSPKVEEENHIRKMMDSFLDENKEYILSKSDDKMLNMFVKSKKMYYLYCNLGKVKKWGYSILHIKGSAIL